MVSKNTTLHIFKKDFGQVFVITKCESATFEDLEEATIIVNNLDKQELEGFKANIRKQNVIQSKDKNPQTAPSKQLTKSLLQMDSYYFEVDRETMTFWSSRKECIGKVVLEKLSTSSSLQALAEGTSALASRNEENSEKMAQTNCKLKSLETTLRSLTIEKNQMEDYMYRAFLKCLNSKKEKIKELQAELNKSEPKECNVGRKRVLATNLPPNKSKARTKVLSSDSETGSDPEDQSKDQSSSDYEADTDTEANVHPNLKFKNSGQNHVSPNDSLNDSFPEFTVAKSKLLSTANQLKLGTKSAVKRSSTTDDDSFIEETDSVLTKSSPPPKKLQKQVVENDTDIEVIYDCDKLIDEF